jgi:hypothetical protein
VKSAALLAASLVLLLAGCGGGDGGGSAAPGGVPTQEESGAERGNLLLGAEVAAYNLCIDLEIDPCGDEAGSVAVTTAFIAKVKEIAAENGIPDSEVADAFSEASDEVGTACDECKRLLDEAAGS